jgi:hypothetical protein
VDLLVLEGLCRERELIDDEVDGREPVPVPLHGNRRGMLEPPAADPVDDGRPVDELGEDPVRDEQRLIRADVATEWMIVVNVAITDEPRSRSEERRPESMNRVAYRCGRSATTPSKVQPVRMESSRSRARSASFTERITGPST